MKLIFCSYEAYSIDIFEIRTLLFKETFINTNPVILSVKIMRPCVN